MKKSLTTGAILSILTFTATILVNAQHTTGADSTLDSNFRNPPVSARPKALWPWVNGNFSLSRITFELEEAKAKGMGGFDIWDVGTNMNPRNIVPDGPPFLGDESLDAIAHTIREATRLGLEIGLITSSSWNAGGSWVKPEHGAMGLFRSDTVIHGPATFTGGLAFPIIPENYGDHKTLVKRDNDGLPVFFKEVALVMHPLKGDSTILNSELIVLQHDPTKPIDIPKGKWRLVRYVCAPTGQPLMVPSPKSNGLMLDHFSAEAQEANMNYIIGKLKTKFKSLGNQSLKYLYEDSYEVNTAVWTPGLPEFFQARTGYQIEKYLPVLDGFTINGKDYTDRLMFDFNKILSDLIIENHYALGKQICEKEGIGFYAEAGGPGQPIHNVPFEDLKALGSLSVPRGEFWRKHPTLEALQIVKGIASASHIYNQKYVEAESFTSVWLWQEGPDELKPLADRAMCEGLNRFVYHTFPHTTPEAGEPGWIYNFGTIINTTNGWWPKSKWFHQYLARCSYLLQQGNFIGDVAFYYGDQAPNFVKPKSIPASLGKGYDYDVVNTDAILRLMQVKDGKIVLPHGQSYEVLVLPSDQRINPLVLQKIEQMVKDGATIIGKRPTRSYSLAKSDSNDNVVRKLGSMIWGNMKGKEKIYGKGKIIWNKSIREVLMEKNIPPDVTFLNNTSTDSCDFIHRKTELEDIYFIWNKSKIPFTGTVTFRIKGKHPKWWNPVNGEVIPIEGFNQTNNGTTIPILLQGEESGFVIFRESSSPGTVSDLSNKQNTPFGTIIPGQEHTQILSSPWKVRFEHKGLSPVEMEMTSLESWHSSDKEDIKYFSGAGIYTNHFSVSKETMSSNSLALLSLIKVEEIADIFLNGERIGTHWYNNQQFDIMKYLREGDNTLIIEVVNSINNALVGDSQKPEQYRRYRSNISKLPNAWMKPFAEAPLLPAGLLGPVEIKWTTKTH